MLLNDRLFGFVLTSCPRGNRGCDFKLLLFCIYASVDEPPIMPILNCFPGVPWNQVISWRTRSCFSFDSTVHLNVSRPVTLSMTDTTGFLIIFGYLPLRKKKKHGSSDHLNFYISIFQYIMQSNFTRSIVETFGSPFWIVQYFLSFLIWFWIRFLSVGKFQTKTDNPLKLWLFL